MPDNDEAGERYADDVARIVTGLEPKPVVKVVRLPLIDDGDDIADWLSDVVPDGWDDAQCRAELEACGRGTGVGCQAGSASLECAQASSQLPEILVTEEEDVVTTQAIAVLPNESNVFQRAGELVWILEEVKPAAKHQRVTRAAGNLRIALLPTEQLQRLLTIHARWFKERTNKAGKVMVVPAHPPAIIVKQVATRGVWPVRPLEGIIETPTLRPDGSVIDSPGYDSETGLWFAPNGDFPPVPINPTKDIAIAAKAALFKIVEDFPFLNDDHRAAWLAALLTSLARFAIDGPCPLFMIDANCPGTGKSKLADIIAILATGREMARGAYPDDKDEMEKMLLSVMLAGDRFLLFDNIKTGGSVGGSAIDRVITSRTIKGRILGKSEMSPELRATVVFFATGNNLRVQGDGLRRIILSRLETREERPETRADFAIKRCQCGCKGNLLTHVKMHRGELVVSALTILRGYIAEGRPDQRLTPMDFPEWCDLVRNTVKWVTGSDPAASRSALVEEDEDSLAIKALVGGWETLCRGLGKTDSSVTEALGELEKGLAANVGLFALVTSWSRDGKLPAPVTFGRKLATYKGRVCDGKSLHASPFEGLTRWSVRVTSNVSPSQSGGDRGDQGHENPSV